MDDGKDTPASEAEERGEGADTKESADTQEEAGTPSEDDAFREVIALIEGGDWKGAQAKLDWFFERGARWHYWQSVVYRKQNWLTDAKKSLQRAASLDPDNEEYKKALEELDAMSQSGKKLRKKKGGVHTMGGEKSCWDACIEGGCECCAMVGCELCCQAICDGLGSC